MKVKVESYTIRGKEKIIHEPIVSDEFWTEHKNFDGSILKVKVTPVTELNERNSVDEGEKSCESNEWYEKKLPKDIRRFRGPALWRCIVNTMQKYNFF